jgi:hypothetical protein
VQRGVHREQRAESHQSAEQHPLRRRAAAQPRRWPPAGRQRAPR